MACCKDAFQSPTIWGICEDIKSSEGSIPVLNSNAEEEKWLEPLEISLPYLKVCGSWRKLEEIEGVKEDTDSTARNGRKNEESSFAQAGLISVRSTSSIN